MRDMLLITLSFVFGFLISVGLTRDLGMVYPDELSKPMYKLCNPQVKMEYIQKFNLVQRNLEVEECVNNESWKGNIGERQLNNE